jgi:hypothetical protein
MDNLTVRRFYSVRLYFAALLVLFALWRFYRIHQDIRYTVATTIARISTPRNHSQIQYTFSVNGKPFIRSAPELEQYKIKYPGGRYFLRFPFKSPGSNEILWDHPVPDSIMIVPPDGWKVLPK